MNRPLGVLWVTIVAIVAAGCAATPSVPVPEGSRIVVRLYDGKQQIELALANESYPEMADLYSTKRPDGNLKLAPDQLMGELLYSLDHEGLALYAQPGPPPDGVTGYLLVDHDGHRRSFVQPSSGAAVEQRQAYVKMKLIMDHYYKHVGQKQFVDNPQGRDIFREHR